VLKRSAATGKNKRYDNQQHTGKNNDELRNMLFKNNPGKIASLKNYSESKRAHPDMTSRITMISGNCLRITAYTKKDHIKLLLFSISRSNLLKFIMQLRLCCN